MNVTKRQKEVLGFIRNFVDENKYAPSVRDIAKYFSLASAGGIHKHLKNLEMKGLLSIGKNISRSIRLLDGDDNEHQSNRPSNFMESLSLPLKGMVAAGAPIEYHLDNETISFPASMVRKPEDTYVLKVSGQSMIEEFICDGDYVIVENRNHANPGEVIIAMINFEEATLKKYYPEKNRIRLQPANHEMEPIFVEPDQFSIHGVVVGVLRSYL